MNKNIEEVDKDIFDRVWKIVEEIGVQERHFNDIQARNRAMASAWLLATLAAIGFVVSKSISIDIDTELLVSGIAVSGSIGIALLWIVDLLVYHRLLDSCFIEGLILEDKHPWLPPFRNNMMRTQQGEGVLFRVVGFYLVPVVFLILVAGGSISLWLGSKYFQYSLISIVLTIFIGIFVGRLILSKTGNTDAIGQRLEESQTDN